MANRHDIYLWEMSKHPVPQSMEEARDLAENLAEQADTLSPALFSVIEKTKAYIAQQDAQIQYAYRWFGKEQEAKACLVLTLPDYGAELGLRFIVQTAMALDLVVYDHEMRMVFLPPDRVLPMEADEYWEALCENLDKPAFPTTDKDFADWFEPKLAQMLAKYGFASKEIEADGYIKKTSKVNGYTIVNHNKYYVRQVLKGEQHIWMTYGDHKHSDEYRPYLHLGILYSPVTETLKQFDFEPPYKGGGGYSFHYWEFGADILLGKFISNYELAFKYITLLESQLIGMAQTTASIKDLDAFLYREKESTYVQIAYKHFAYTPFTLVLAYLANSPHFEQVAKQLTTPLNLANAAENKQNRYHTEYAKLHKYLREEVKPLV